MRKKSNGTVELIGRDREYFVLPYDTPRQNCRGDFLPLTKGKRFNTDIQCHSHNKTVSSY